MALIDEPLPNDPLQAEAVLHVRAALRRQIRARESVAQALSILFDLNETEVDPETMTLDDDPVGATARALAKTRGSSIVALGSSVGHLERCRQWLLARKNRDDAFHTIVAFDLHTLTTLSRARDVASLHDRLAPPDGRSGRPCSPVLLTGETGTGKELLAGAVHTLWARVEPGRPSTFVPLHVAGMPPQFVDDELFGHVRGAYTGAMRERTGRLEEADGGGVLLDEVGDLSPDTQVRLLRFLDRGEVLQTGANEIRRVRVRVLAATLKNLDEEAAAGRFRRDLLHRLRAVHLELPPLRTRTHFDDVIRVLLERAGHEAKLPISRCAMGALGIYGWPGNLRELRHVLNLAIDSAEGNTIELDDLPSHVRRPYLELPLELRAADHICEETDQRPLTIELVEHRVASALASMEACDPPEIESDLDSIAAFLKGIPDDAPEHAGAMERVRNARNHEAEAVRAESIKRRWSIVSASSLTELARPIVRARALGIESHRDWALARYQTARNDLRLDDNPWWALHDRVRSLPLLHGASTEDVYSALQLAFRFVLSLPDQMRDEVVESVRAKKGWHGIWQVFAPLFDDDTVTVLPADERKPADQPPEFWAKVGGFRSMAEAVKLTGYSDKPIRQYLREHGITPLWNRKNGAKLSDG